MAQRCGRRVRRGSRHQRAVSPNSGDTLDRLFGTAPPSLWARRDEIGFVRSAGRTVRRTSRRHRVRPGTTMSDLVGMVFGVFAAEQRARATALAAGHDERRDNDWDGRPPRPPRVPREPVCPPRTHEPQAETRCADPACSSRILYALFYAPRISPQRAEPAQKPTRAEGIIQVFTAK